MSRDKQRLRVDLNHIVNVIERYIEDINELKFMESKRSDHFDCS